MINELLFNATGSVKRCEKDLYEKVFNFFNPQFAVICLI